MGLFEITLTLGLFILIQVTLMVKCDEVTNCMELERNVSKVEEPSIQKCVKSVGVKTLEEVKEEHMGCFSKCFVTERKWVDEQGNPSKEKILNGLENAMDDKMKKKYQAYGEKCIDEFAKGNTIDVDDPNDQSCNSNKYGPLFVCIVMAVPFICGDEDIQLF